MARTHAARTRALALAEEHLPLVVGIALLLWAATQLPSDLDPGLEPAGGRLPPRAEREWRPVDMLGLPRDAVSGAASLIPRGATYAVVVDPAAEVAVPRVGLIDVLHYWLLPRRWTNDVRSAGWVIAVGSTSSLPVELREPVEVSPGFVVAEVAR